MLQKIYFMVFERYIPELKKYDGILFLHQPMTSGQPLEIVQGHMAHPVCICRTLKTNYFHLKCVCAIMVQVHNQFGSIGTYCTMGTTK